MFAMSPTMLKSFQNCPAKFHAQYITKKLPWKQSPQAARGEQIHAVLEAGSRDGIKSIHAFPAYKELDAATRYAIQKNLESIERLKQEGWIIQPELSLAINSAGTSVGWKDKSGFIRSKIDILATNPQKDFGIIIDWKTGKKYDEEIQLYINALCAVPVTGLTKYFSLFAYIDSDDAKPFNIHVDVPNPSMFHIDTYKDSPMATTLCVVHNLLEAEKENFWPATDNTFCNWCELVCPGKQQLPNHWWSVKK